MKLNRRGLFARLAALGFWPFVKTREEPEAQIYVIDVVGCKLIGEGDMLPVLFKRYEYKNGRWTVTKQLPEQTP